MHLIKLISILTLLLTSSLSIAKPRTIIIGFDGMDPKILEKWMQEGHLPNFKNLSNHGYYQALGTTNPAQSPVAWSSFATGLNPGQHGVFDFIHREIDNYQVEYSISGLRDTKSLDILGLSLPISNTSVYNKRKGKPYWITAEENGYKTSIFRVPVTYPPDQTYQMLSGMGVPDILGTQGTYSYYSTRFVDPSEKGGSITRVKLQKDFIETEIEGPQNPFSGKPLLEKMRFTKANDSNSILLEVSEENYVLKEQKWSDWVSISFNYMGFFSIQGLAKFYLEESFPRFKLYMSPIHIDPTNPLVQISHPNDFANKLSSEIDLFHTLGMPEETWSLNDTLLSDEAYLDMIKTILKEREAMLYFQLEQKQLDIITNVFVQTDRVSHMFWRGLDKNHPVHGEASDIAKGAILWIYKEADRILGNVLNKINKEDKLIILSDHGFAPYYYHVHLNQWLLREGYLTLKNKFTDSDFKSEDIDWSKTKVYAMGLNGLYLNLEGREQNGIVSTKEINQLKTKLKKELEEWQHNQLNVIKTVYLGNEIYKIDDSKSHSPDLVIGYNQGYRASWQTVLGAGNNQSLETNTDKWSGDHCIDPSHVPGVFLSNFTPAVSINSIQDISSVILNSDDEYKNSFVIAGILDAPRNMIMKALKFIENKSNFILSILLSSIIFSFLLLASKNLSKKIKLKPVKYVFVIIIFCISTIFINSYYHQYGGGNLSSDKITIGLNSENNANLGAMYWKNNTQGNRFASKTTQAFNREDIIDQTLSLFESDNVEVFQLHPSSSGFIKTKPSFLSYIFSNPIGYLSPHSQIKKITIQGSLNHLWWISLIFCLGLVFLIKMVMNYRQKLV